MFRKLQAFLRPRSLVERVQLGKEADRWLKDETLNLALARLREANYNAWRVSANPRAQERAWLMAHVIDEFVAILNALVTAGEAAENMKKQQDRREKRNGRMTSTSRLSAF